MKPEEMKIRETVSIPKINGETYQLLPEKDIVKFLQLIKLCPFCHSPALRKDKSYGSLILTCTICDFQITSSHLYHQSRVQERMKTIDDVVSATVKEAVEKHKQELMEKLPLAEGRLKRIQAALKWHLDT
jgi:uncharacterized Zn finger protein (UPF0148 family)